MRNIICFTIVTICIIVVIWLFDRTPTKKPFPTDPNDPALIIRKLPNGGVERILTKKEESDFNLTDTQFEKIKEDLRKQKEEGIKNRPAPQGEYQWEGYLKFHPAFGEYQALYKNGIKVGGLFAGNSRWKGEYHQFDEHGGVYSEKSEPPVPLRPLK